MCVGRGPRAVRSVLDFEHAVLRDVSRIGDRGTVWIRRNGVGETGGLMMRKLRMRRRHQKEHEEKDQRCPSGRCRPCRVYESHGKKNCTQGVAGWAIRQFGKQWPSRLT